MRLHGRLFGALIVPVAAAFIVAACGSSASGTGTGGGGGATKSATPAASSGATAGGAATGATGAQASNVTIQNFAFTPQTLTVKAGATVTWTNKDSVPHDVTSADGLSTSATTTSLFSSGTMSSGQSFSFTFKKPGTYFYECTIHAAEPTMHAKVVVK